MGKPSGTTTLDANGRTRRVIGQTIARPVLKLDFLSWALAVLGKRQSCVRMHEAGPVSF
jgi:hypothetical protein